MNGEAERRDRSRTPSPLSRSSSRGSIGHPSPGRTTLLKRNQSLSAKQIRFYRNGEKYYAGLKLAVSSERYKEFPALLAELSQKLNLKTGAVRYIFDAETGAPLTDVSQLNSNSSYVCSSSNIFKELDGGYGQTQPKSWHVGASKDRSELNNWDKSSLKVDGRREFVKPKLVTVVKNGKPPQKKVTMLLNKKTAVALSQVLDHLSSKGTLGKVDRLCCLDGREIKELRDLFNEDMIFIAFSSNERFPEEGFDVDVQSPKLRSWNTSIKPSRDPYLPSLRTELDIPWKQLPRARCIACALRALTTNSTPPPSQSYHRPRPKSAGPRLNSSVHKLRRSDPRPYSAGARPPEPKPLKDSPHSKGEKKTGGTSGGKKTNRLRSSFPTTSTPKLSTKKSLSFSSDTKSEETTDSGPKPKGIRGGGRLRKAQLAALENGEEMNPNDPRHAYYILIHEELKSGKPTASVKPIMSSESLANQTVTVNNEKKTTSELNNSGIVVNSVPKESTESVGVTEVMKVTHTTTQVGSQDEKPADICPDEKPIVVASSEKPTTVQSPYEKKSPVNANKGNDEPRDWSKPKAIRGRRKKPSADVNGNEQKKTEEIAKTSIIENGVVTENDKEQPINVVISNGDGL